VFYYDLQCSVVSHSELLLECSVSVCCNVLQCVAVCCSVLQCAAVSYSDLLLECSLHMAGPGSGLAFCSVWQCVPARENTEPHCNSLQLAATQLTVAQRTANSLHLNSPKHYRCRTLRNV